MSSESGPTEPDDHRAAETPLTLTGRRISARPLHGDGAAGLGMRVRRFDAQQARGSVFSPRPDRRIAARLRFDDLVRYAPAAALDSSLRASRHVRAFVYCEPTRMQKGCPAGSART
jgi:hypothetical protein